MTPFLIPGWAPPGSILKPSGRTWVVVAPGANGHAPGSDPNCSDDPTVVAIWQNNVWQRPGMRIALVSVDLG